jgi:FKBP-type peptidyl-prolyl cis-trans isomerase FkpA
VSQIPVGTQGAEGVDVKKWAFIVILLLFLGSLLLRRLRKRKNASLVTLSQNVRFVSEDLIEGSGAMATTNKVVFVHYLGRLLDGRVFDSSRERGEPFQFVLGAGRVIAGWEKGVAGMKVGGRRRLVLPPELGYGSRGAGKLIPPGAALEFEIELLDVK